MPDHGRKNLLHAGWIGSHEQRGGESECARPHRQRRYPLHHRHFGSRDGQSSGLPHQLQAERNHAEEFHAGQLCAQRNQFRFRRWRSLEFVRGRAWCHVLCSRFAGVDRQPEDVLPAVQCFSHQPDDCPGGNSGRDLLPIDAQGVDPRDQSRALFHD